MSQEEEQEEKKPETDAHDRLTRSQHLHKGVESDSAEGRRMRGSWIIRVKPPFSALGKLTAITYALPPDPMHREWDDSRNHSSTCIKRPIGLKQSPLEINLTHSLIYS
ncbi:unnamed protein product [Pleuronectes platessa]|uniref:Uncharacterized protein n=1 Tax=Pleuronectes platessa TaxID=8262 RepID=A0A9N7YXD2_PLEPL|nr:unnamed protein product [Pleuronectes platessa]